MIVFKTDPTGRPVTESGRPVTCDGCGVRLTTAPTEAQQRQVPEELARRVYGQDLAAVLAAGEQPLTYVVCERGIDCSALAELADELYQAAACKDPLCTGDGTLARPCRTTSHRRI